MILVGFRTDSRDFVDILMSIPGSVKQAASTVAAGMVKFYTGGVDGQIISQMPGILPGPYYWWEAGAMMGSLIDYWYYTGDEKYNSMVSDAMQFQVGDEDNYEPTNQTKSLGNDDQAFWALAAMSAAEVKFPNPPEDKPQWLALAQAVFNSQANRWDTAECAGGLKWQIFPFNNGYNYRNSISNGCFFNLAARLGAYTGNQTYFDWANKMWDWCTAPTIALIDNNYMVYDGTDDQQNCTSMNHVQWSYNNGVFLLGAATMWNQTEGAVRAEWEARITGLIQTATRIFFKSGTIMFESACEPRGNCNVDQRSFKAYLARWMAATTKVAPWTHDLILPLLQSSAEAAAISCSGEDGSTCGMRWTEGAWDGQTGVGEQMSALEVIQSGLIDLVPGPVSRRTGGISKGDASAGSGGDNIFYSPITTGDRAGAGILTFIILLGLIGGTWWLVS